MLRVRCHSREESDDLIVRLKANGAEERRCSNLALAVDLYVELILAARLKLKPCASIWNHLRGPERTTRYWINGVGVEDAR